MVRTITTLIVTAFCLIGTFSLKAEGKTALIVELNDGTKAQFILAEQPTMVPDGANVVFESTTAKATYARSNVSKFYFGTVDENAVPQTPDNTGITFRALPDYILLTNDNTLPTPQVYNVMGVQFPASVSRISDNSVQVSISNLPQGLYIITVRNQSFKFLKK
jgi:hypothetical protein